MNNELRIMQKKLKILFRILLTAYCLLYIAVPKAHAENIALGIYPPIIQIQAKAPSEIRSPMTVSNESTTPLDVKIGLRPFTQSQSDNGQPQYFFLGQRLGEDPQIYQKMSMFDGTRNTDEIMLAPNQKKNMELRISLPTGEPPGDYYFSVTFISKAIGVDNVSSAAISGGISTNVLLSIGPYDTTTGYIKEFSSPLFVDHGPVPFTIHVQNTSKHFISPAGGIVIKNMFGQIIGKVNLAQENVLAGTSRYLPDNNATPLISTANPTAVWGEKFLLGPYSATLTLALSGEGPLYRRTIYFFALPIQVIIGIILAIILLTVVIYRVKKKLR